MAYISNQQTNPNDPNQQQGPSSQPSATGMSSGSTPSAAPAPVNQQKGSGRFTNIQKYINANQGAGERLASGVGRKIEAQVQPKAEQAQSQAQAVGQAIQESQNKVQQGQQLQQQVAQENFDVTGFASQQPNLQQFTQYRTGQAVDENALRQQAQANQMSAQQAQQAAQGFNQQLGTETGRGQLLKQSFSPTRTYSMGQQRLDNLFLSRATPQLQNIQSGLQQTSQNLGNLLNENTVRQQSIQDLASQEQEIAQGLTGAITSKEQALEQALTGRISDVNAQREAERQKYLNFANQLIQSGQGKALDQELDSSLLGETGLQLGQQTFNVFKDPTLDARQLLSISDRNAQNIQDVAQQADVDKYKALAALGGFEPSKLTKVGELERAAGIKSGEGSIQQRVQDAQMKFLEDAIKQNITGTGTKNWKSKDALRGKKGTEAASATLNLNQVLGGDYTAAMRNAGVSGARDVLGQIAQDPNAALAATFTTGNAAALIPGAMASIANALPSVFGNPNAGKQQRARDEAQRIANADVINKLNAYLQSRGFDQYLGSKGIATGSTKLEDYGYGTGSAENANRGRYNLLENKMKVE